MVDFANLESAPMLAGLGEEHLESLRAIASERDARAGDRLFARGDAAETFYLVKDGRFALTLQLRRLGEYVELAVEEKGAGAALGWSSLVEPYRSIYSCYCTANGSLIAFPRGELARLMSLDRDLGNRLSINLNQLIADRLRALQNLWIEEIQQSTARIDYWSQTEIANHLTLAFQPDRQRKPARRRLFGRGGSPPSPGGS